MKSKLISFFLIFVFLYSFMLTFQRGAVNSYASKNLLFGLGEGWSEGAGLSTRDYEYGYLQTSQWTKMIANLKSGNQMLIANLFHLSGTPLPLRFSLTYNSLNALTDLGIGKGWTTNLHSRIFENPETHDLIYLDETGFRREFVWKSENQQYVNPFGFAGIAQKLPTGYYEIIPLDSGPIVFDNHGRLVEIQDRSSTGKLIVSYNSDGQPQSLTDFLSGRSLTLAWDTSGCLESIKDPMNHEWGFTRDSNHYLKELIKPGEASVKSSFGYDTTTGRILSHTDFENQTYLIEYYNSGENTGLLKTWTQPSNEEVKTSFVYETATGYNRKTSVTDGNGHSIHYFFGVNTNALEKIILGSEGPEQVLHYNSAGFIDSFTDALNMVTNFTYDDIYHLTSITLPPPIQNGVSPVYEYVYDSASLMGNLVLYREKVANTDPPTWANTQFFYTDANTPFKPSMIINPMNEATSFVFDANGMLTSLIEPTVERGIPPVSTKTTYFVYDPVSKVLLRKTDTEGNDVAYQYNLNGFPVSETQYEGSYLGGSVLYHREFLYNPLNQITMDTNTITNQVSSRTWNQNGALISQISERGCEQSIVPIYQNVVILPGDSKNYHNLEIKLGNPVNRLLPESLSFYQPNYSSSTDSLGHTSTYQYRNDGTLFKMVDYLSRTVQFSQDDLGRLSGISQSNGHTMTYLYDLNSRIISVNSNRDGITTLEYDNTGRIRQKASPVKGVIDYSYNTRGDMLSDEKAEYYYDLLGRLIGMSYINGGSDFWTYDADGKIASNNGAMFEYDKLGNLTRWQNENADTGTLWYDGPTASRMLGLPGILNGTGNLSSYAYEWNAQGWLDNLTPVGKAGDYQYGWSSTRELTSISFPNAVSMAQSWTSKMLDSIHVRYNQTDYLLTDTEYDNNDRMTGYTEMVMTDELNSMTETHGIAYDAQGRMSELSYMSLNRSVQFHYQEGNGLPDSILFSDLGEYKLAYNSLTGNISSITYPNQSGTESYVYNGGLGRLSRISYPGNKNLSMIWNDKNQITRITYSDQGILTNYIFTYTFSGDLAGYTKSEGGIQTANWTFIYGPFGLEKAVRTTSPSITQDFTTDPYGRILSMTYTQAGNEANGEYYFHYDNFGNTTLLTDSLGRHQYSAIYDILHGKVRSEWNPHDFTIINKGAGINGTISVKLSDEIEIAFSETIRLRNRYTMVNISDTTIRIQREISKEECKEICYKSCAIDPSLLKRCLLACEEGKFCSE